MPPLSSSPSSALRSKAECPSKANGPVVAVGGAHHGDLDALAAHSGDATGPFAFDGHSAFERKAELGEELNGGIDVFHHDADVVHTLDSQDVSLASNVRVLPRRAERGAARWRRRTTTRC